MQIEIFANERRVFECDFTGAGIEEDDDFLIYRIDILNILQMQDDQAGDLSGSGVVERNDFVNLLCCFQSE
jgi:hypothetical protein